MICERKEKTFDEQWSVMGRNQMWYKSPVNILVFIHQKETSLYSHSKSQDVVNLIGDLYFRNKLREVEAVRHVEAVTRARGQHLPLQRGPGLQAHQLSLW